MNSSRPANPEAQPTGLETDLDAIDLGALQERLRSGDESARAALFEACWGPILRIAVHVLGRSDAALDTATSVAMDLLGPRPHGRPPAILRFDDSRPLLPWLSAMVAHKAIDAYRANSRKRSNPPRENAPLDGVADPKAASADDVLARRELARQLTRARRHLSRDENAMLELWLSGEPYETIARLFGVAEGTVGSRLNTIKNTLRAKFHER